MHGAASIFGGGRIAYLANHRRREARFTRGRLTHLAGEGHHLQRGLGLKQLNQAEAGAMNRLGNGSQFQRAALGLDSITSLETHAPANSRERVDN